MVARPKVLRVLLNETPVQENVTLPGPPFVAPFAYQRHLAGLDRMNVMMMVAFGVLVLPSVLSEKGQHISHLDCERHSASTPRP
jgi:hypothetical protein